LDFIVLVSSNEYRVSSIKFLNFYLKSRKKLEILDTHYLILDTYKESANLIIFFE